jgi:hypothetical protein
MLHILKTVSNVLYWNQILQKYFTVKTTSNGIDNSIFTVLHPLFTDLMNTIRVARILFSFLW